MTYQSPLDLQQYLHTLQKENLLTNLNIANMQTRNYVLYHVLGNILSGKTGIKVRTQTGSLLCLRNHLMVHPLI